jgi:hypothetical protein
MLCCEIEPYLQKSVIAFATILILRPGGVANLFAGDKRMVGFWRKPSNSIVAVMSANGQGGLRQPNEEQLQEDAEGDQERNPIGRLEKDRVHNDGD